LFGKKRQTNARFIDEVLKTRGIKYLTLRLGCCLALPYWNF